MRLAVRIDIHVQRHGMAADRTVFNVVLVRAGRDIDRDHDLFAAGVADIRRFKVCGWPFASAFEAFLRHERGSRGRCPSDTDTPQERVLRGVVAKERTKEYFRSRENHGINHMDYSVARLDVSLRDVCLPRGSTNFDAAVGRDADGLTTSCFCLG